MTFEFTPPAYSSVNDSLIWVVYDAHSTDPVTYPNYKYVAELWVNGVKVATSRKFQNPENNRGIFDFSTEIREYITPTLQGIGSGIVAKQLGNGSWSVDVQIKLREEYYGTIGAIVAEDSQRVYFNHYNGRNDEFTILSSLANKPLSTRQNTIEVFFEQDNFFLPYFSETTANFNVTIVGSTTRVKTITPTQNNSLQILNISPAAINTEWSGTITSAMQSYTVTVGGTTYLCKLICEPVHTNYPIHFMNKYGGFETFNFYKAKKTNYEITRKSWRQPAYRVSNTGSVTLKTGNIMHDQLTVFGVRFSEKLTVSTDLLNDDDYRFLSQLMVSPIIYVQDGSILYPVSIEQSNYQPLQIETDDWNNIELELSFNTTYKTQYQ